VTLKRLKKVTKRPVADLLIGGFSLRHQGLITRNPSDFLPFYPELAVVEA
jgi:predicted nucleic acid-binding protein